MELSLDPGVLASLAVAEVLYVRAVRILRGRGVAVSRGQRALWHAGIGLWLIGLLSPVDAWGSDLLSAHMAQHLLIADLAAPLLLAGMRNPVLAFLLPRPALVALARRRRLRAAFRALRRPLVAIPVYALVLYLWHFDFAFTAAVRHDAVHALQHASFVGIGMLVWWSALEPKRRRLRGDLWKIGHILAARLLGMFLGMSFVIIRQPVYTDVYGAGERRFGLSAIADQQLAGGMMVVLDVLVMLFALTFFFVRAARDSDRDDAARPTVAAT
ncbi:MAG: cytochrome c oxidase assembly protein [Actinomycetota bacterium]|nr:cytochrome c oxidase assembly protein [Actinomycetota bacterium]